MGVKIVDAFVEREPLLFDTVLHARRQQYTPERLCVLQKVIETQYYYYWLMDLKKEEYAVDLFGPDFRYFYNNYEVKLTGEQQALRSKWVNSQMVTMHMCHQPLVWLMDDAHARGIFQYEDHNVYREDGQVVESWTVYCNDFTKNADGVWQISTLRLYQKQGDGRFRNINPPEGWKPDDWEKEAAQRTKTC